MPKLIEEKVETNVNINQTFRTDNNKEYVWLWNFKFGVQKLFAFTKFKNFLWYQNLTNVYPMNLKFYNRTDADEKIYAKKEILYRLQILITIFLLLFTYQGRLPLIIFSDQD